MAETVVIEFVADASQLQPAVDSLESLGAIDKKVADEFRKSNTAYADRNKALAQQKKSTDEAHVSLDQMSQSVRDLNKNVIGNANTETLKKFSKEITGATTQSTRLTTELRNLKQQLSVLEAAGKTGTAEFTKLAVAAGKLQDQIGDTANRVRILASDTKNLDAALSVATGVAGGFALAQGAAALFGKENEDVQKALLKVQASLAVLNGLQQVAATLNKDSAASVVLLSAAQKAYTFVVGASTGAMKAFRLALAATGIGLLVIGIIALVQNFDKLKNAVGLGVNPELEELAAKKRKLVEISKDLADGTSLEERRLRALGATDSEILNLRIKNINKYLTALSIQYKAEQEIFDAKAEAFAKENALISALKGSGVFGSLGGAFLSLLGVGSNEEMIEQGQVLKDLSNTFEEAKVNLLETQKELNTAFIKEGVRLQDEIKILTDESILAAIPGEPAADPIVTYNKAVNDLIVDNLEERIAREDQAIKDANLQKLQEQQIYIDASAQLVGRLFDFGAALRDAELSDLQDKRDRGIISEANYAKQVSDIKTKQAIAEKQRNVFETIINTARAIVAALPNVALSVLSGVIGAVELATILATPIPKFAKGTESVKGGIAGKDSVPAILMPGERIVPAHINQQLQGISNIELPEMIRRAQYPSLPYISDATITAMEQRRFSSYGSEGIDYERLAEELGKQIARHERLEVNINERGFEKRIISRAREMKILNDSYSWNS